MATKIKTLKKKSSKLAVQSENEQGEKRSKSVKKNLVQDEENAKDNTGKENPDAGESRSKKKKQPEESGAQTPSPSLSAEEQKRGQFRKNIVSPVHPDQQGSRASLQSRASARQDGSNMGSAISVQSHLSHTSVREAWTDNSDVENGPTPQPRPGSAATVNSSVVSLREGSNRRLSGVREDSMVVAKPEQHAYIPYLYARKSIVKIMNDMENMKQNHIEIVGQIEIQYKSIETETQSQFNTFVICLRQQYYEKVENFRQIINAHKEEIEKKEAYWNSTLASLVVRNNELLRDKKHLYIQSKEEIERLEQEKTILREELINKLGLAQADLSSVEEKSAEEYRKLSEENKILNDQLENEKAEVEKLKTLVAKQAVGQTSSTVVEKVTTAPLLAAAVVSDDNEEERQKMEEERRAMSEERMRWDVERNQFAEEKKNWLNELNKLQGNISAEAVECAEWRAKYDSLKTQLQDMADLQANYHALECQYAALGTLVASSENSKQAAEENAKKTEAEKIMMEEEKRKMEADILKWEKEFKKKHKREPVDEDKSDMVKEMYIQNEELETMVTSLDTKLHTYNQVEDGKVPEAPMVQPVPLVIKDPEIKIVEVKVPDPTVVAALEKIQAENTALLAQITALNQKNSQLQEEITRQTTEITQLGNTITTLEAAASAGGISTVGVDQEVHALLVAQVESKDKNISDLEHRLEEKDEELDQMKKTHREMQKDMKKMIKEQIKLQMKADAAGGNEESQKMLLIIVGAVRKVEEEDQETAKKLAKQLEAAEKKLKEAKDAQVSHQKAVDSSEAKHGKKSVKDRDAETKKLYKDLNSSTKQVEEAELEVSALKLLITGDVSIVKKPVTDTKATPDETAVANLEQQLSAVDDRIAELEMENDALKDEKNNLSIKIKDLEQKLEQAKVQTQLQVTAAPPVSVFSEGDEELSEQITDLQKQVDSLEAALLQEKSAHDNTRDELDNVRKQLDLLKEEFSNHKVEMDAEFDVKSQSLKSDIMAKEEELKKLRERNEEIEQERLANVPVDTAKEIKNLRNKLTNAEKEKTGTASASHMLQSQIKELETKLALANKNLEAQRASNRDMEAKLKNGRFEKEKALKDLAVQIEKKEQQRTIEDKRRITSLEKMVKESQSAGPKAAAVGAVKGGTVAGADKNLRDQLAAAKRENNELNTRIKQLEAEIKRIGQKDADQAIQDKSVTKKHEKILKELIGKLEIEKSKVERTEGALATTQNDLKETKKLLNEKEREAMKLTADLAVLGETAKVGLEAAARVKVLESESKRLIDENAVLTENYNSERVLRKKYYNMVEDMKGKIRVYCRSRPLSKTELQNGNSCVVRSPDEYSVVLSTQRGEREFQFDQIFMDDSTQEKVFEDTNNLVQSAVDGYNVCIFAYGQTGSGKTFTMIGDKEQRFPGIAPRAFNRIFELTAELKKKMTIEISTYMMELYNDHLIDLFCRPGAFDESKLDIKKDKKGLVYVSGAVIKQASSAKELFALFEEGSKNRHTASTKMNDESSRSHLVVSVIMECTNIATGQVTRGKLSLVDLAGSERVGKTGATADQLKEAMSINKSLSALGDVISALSSEQQFIPYRNNKLTMLMQDSLGGNAKTLMFVNISPADYNVDESVISLTYASRVKLITNDASKNAENKEIARLKSIIAKLKRGEDGSDAEED